jgi:hypothetical protein
MVVRVGRAGPPDRLDAVVVVGLTLLVSVPVWPGIYTIDSQQILQDARLGEVSNWYAPLLGWVWGLIDGVGIPPGVVFLVGVFAFVGAVLALVRQFLPRSMARVVTLGVVLFPPVYGLLGWVGRDVWFATAAVGITACALRAHRTAGVSNWNVGALGALSIVAADARQNGAPFALLGFGVATAGVLRLRSGSLVRGARSTVIACGAIAGLLIVGGLQSAVTKVEHHPEQIMLARDLTAVTLDTGSPAMDDFLFPSQDVELLEHRLGGLDPDAVIALDPPVARYSPWSGGPGAGVINDEYQQQWIDMIKRDPVSYLRMRLDLYLDQLGITREVRSPHFERSDELPGGAEGVENSFPELLRIRNLVLSWTDGTAGSGSILHAPALYLVAAMSSIWQIGRRVGERRAAVVLVAVLAAMQALLFFTAPTSQYRFQFFQVVIGATFFAVLLAMTITTNGATSELGYRAGRPFAGDRYSRRS